MERRKFSREFKIEAVWTDRKPKGHGGTATFSVA
jgi:hypothetical protein